MVEYVEPPVFEKYYSSNWIMQPPRIGVKIQKYIYIYMCVCIPVLRPTVPKKIKINNRFDLYLTVGGTGPHPRRAHTLITIIV